MDLVFRTFRTMSEIADNLSLRQIIPFGNPGIQHGDWDNIVIYRSNKHVLLP